MTWHRIEKDGEVQIVCSLDGIDTDAWTCVLLSEDRQPEGLEEVDVDGNIHVPVDKLKAFLWDEVKAIRAEKLALAPTTFGTAQADLESMVKINGLVSMATIAKSLSAPFSEVFTMADNSEVTLSADQMISFGIQVGTHIANVHARGRALRAAIDGGETDVDITTGWP